MNHHSVNMPISRFTAKLIGTYLKFPEGKPITAMDLRCADGMPLTEITKKHEESYLYGASRNVYYRAENEFEKICEAHYKREHKITPNAFSLALVNPEINYRLVDEVLSEFDPFSIPDFEEEERRRIQAKLEELDQIDFSDDDTEDSEKHKEELEAKIKKAAKEREIAYRRALREQERRMASLRDDKYLIALVSEKLTPGGVMILVAPKEFIDGHVSHLLTSRFEDIAVFRLDDDEYEKQRKVVLFAKKKKKFVKVPEEAYQLMQYKYKPYREIDVLEPQAKPMYEVPSKSKEDILNFRIGPVSPEEVMSALQKSSLIQQYQETYSQILDNEVPKPPTHLHKGHVALLLASGYLNGYIGSGPDQHLVKGSARKMVKECIEEDGNDPNRSQIKEREYFSIGVKYLDRHGQFHTLM